MARRPHPFDDVEEMLDRLSGQFDATAGVPVDVVDEGDAYAVAADLPGFETEDIDVSLDDRTLTIEADHAESTAESDATYLRRERTARSVSRRVTLPGPVDRDGATATRQNGVLTVTVPKRDDSASGRSIEVE